MSSPHPTLPPSELRGHGLLLRAWDPDSADDADAWLRGLTDPEFRRWNTPLRPVDDLAGARRSLRARVALAEEGSTLSFHVADDTDGTPLGHIGIQDIHPVMRVGRIGYWVLPEAGAGRGHPRGPARRALGPDRGRPPPPGTGPRDRPRGVLPHRDPLRLPPGGHAARRDVRPDRHDAFRDTHLHARLATDREPAGP